VSTWKSRPVGPALGWALVFAIATAFAAGPATAQVPTEEREHVVRRGDTLWDLARAYFNNPFLWPVIYEANRAVVRDPHWIYPAERLVIPGIRRGEFMPIGEPVEEWARAPVEVVEEVDEAVPARPMVLETVDLARPLVRTAEYRTAPWLGDLADHPSHGRLVRMVDPAVTTDRLESTLRPFDKVYFDGFADARPLPGDSLLVVRFERTVGQFGRIIRPLAVLRIDSLAAVVSEATVARQFGDARIGDYVIRLDALPEMPVGQLQATDESLQGTLLDFLEQHALYGAADYGFINLGRIHGLAIGDEITVFMPERTTRAAGTPLPPTDIATARVIRLGDSTATVRVVMVNTTELNPGLPVRLVRRAP
jgi:hypothetical protein